MSTVSENKKIGLIGVGLSFSVLSSLISIESLDLESLDISDLTEDELKASNKAIANNKMIQAVFKDLGNIHDVVKVEGIKVSELYAVSTYTSEGKYNSIQKLKSSYGTITGSQSTNFAGAKSPLSVKRSVNKCHGNCHGNCHGSRGWR